ncbi:amidohydrolase family protein [Vibrio aestuarianus]|uniref:amidohydrolase family protein n=1 Tax=Vibrio aestuarianus TaxID=28171 RepID=UPI001592C180|nr:hypothetical protein [Vibrio aestuarianus]MDE1311294.1 hypothetical protein [Vibrio aestuarianus]
MFKKTLLVTSIAATSFISSFAIAAENVDLLITNATVLTMDNDKKVYPNGLVAVKENQIVAVSDGRDIDQYKALQTIDAEGDIVMPGLINTHTALLRLDESIN